MWNFFHGIAFHIYTCSCSRPLLSIEQPAGPWRNFITYYGFYSSRYCYLQAFVSFIEKRFCDDPVSELVQILCEALSCNLNLKKQFIFLLNIMLASYFINQELFNTALQVHCLRSFFHISIYCKTQCLITAWILSLYVGARRTSRVTDNLNYFLIKLYLLKMDE